MHGVTMNIAYNLFEIHVTHNGYELKII